MASRIRIAVWRRVVALGGWAVQEPRRAWMAVVVTGLAAGMVTAAVALEIRDGRWLGAGRAHWHPLPADAWRPLIDERVLGAVEFFGSHPQAADRARVVARVKAVVGSIAEDSEAQPAGLPFGSAAYSPASGLRPQDSVMAFLVRQPGRGATPALDALALCHWEPGRDASEPKLDWGTWVQSANRTLARFLRQASPGETLEARVLVSPVAPHRNDGDGRMRILIRDLYHTDVSFQASVDAGGALAQGLRQDSPRLATVLLARSGEGSEVEVTDLVTWGIEGVPGSEIPLVRLATAGWLPLSELPDVSDQ